MSCNWTQTRLFDYLDGVLETETLRQVERHLETCTECAGYAEALGNPIENGEDLTRAVLRQTADDRCAQSLEQLPGWVDGDLETVDAELVAGHVMHCDECTRVAAVLRAMEVDLHELADVAPDPAFVNDVLAATVRIEPLLPWVARLDAWFTNLLQRPRIALEGAYIACACLALLIAFPGSPLADVPKKALELTRTDPNRIEQPFVALRTNLNVGTQEAVFTTRVAARSLAVRASAESGDVYRKVKRRVGTLWDRFASDPLSDETLTRDDSPTNGESK